ncbi:MAG: CPBP family intramembrane glutamic endopeptidase [Luteimonas sp.]
MTIQLVVAAPAISSGWRSIFRRPTFRDIAIALACVPATVILPAIVAFLVIGSANLSANPVIEDIGSLAPAAVVNMFATSGVQLIGEELVTILPFLALVTLLNRLGFKPWLTIGLSWIVTSLAFGALHLPTYDWHAGQALIGIGLARVVLTGVFLLTKNLWASTVTHVVNDWLMLTISVLAGHAVH